MTVTTLPAKAGSFCTVQSPWLQQELLVLRIRQPVTLAHEGPIQAHCDEPRHPRTDALTAGFSPCTWGGIERNPHRRAPFGQHTGQVLPVGLPHGTPYLIVHVKVLS